MSSNYLTHAGLCLGMTMIFAGSALCAPPANSTSKTADPAKTAARMLRDIRSDAAQIQTAASELDKLTASSNPTWIEYDRQWNLMKPAEEDLQRKLARLESMQANLSTSEQNDVNQSKALIGTIQARTRELRMLLDQNGVQTNNAKFKIYATSLSRSSRKLEHAASAS